ncbi:erg24, C-14 sterol reductase [Diatrype stigma]|uniref:Delta(14)-sterol reductase n=1 Tax=Diatrype stigma TaxID=117547 RepID=A0AAN9UJ96_9PEZI
MAPKTKNTEPPHGYEFGGPFGAAAITFGTPFLCYLFTFACNDITGCPAPSLLHPKSLSLEQLKYEVGWPEDGLLGFVSWNATLATLGYYAFNALLYVILPATEAEGTQLRSGGRLKYRLNSFASIVTTLVVLIAGTIAQGAEFPVWTFITDNYLQLLTTNLIIAYSLSVWVYIRSFSVKPPGQNTDNRELAAGGHTGNLIYDFYIGRELNPRVTLPILGEIDIKSYMELRPGLLGWIVLNWAFVAKQYRNFGWVSDSAVFVAAIQTIYVLDSQYMESAILTTMDITTDGFGFMLAFGDVVWVPFMYSTQTRYLATHPVVLGPWGLAGVAAILATGYSIFRASNSQKNTFRTNPNDPSVAHIKYIETKTGSRLMVSGWWGVARHINYLGDLTQAFPYSIPTGFAGYAILSAGTNAEGALKMRDGREVVQGDAKYWGMLFTYFYIVYFAILLIHRDRRDDEKCARKYGADWEKYKKIVKYRIVPGLY